jgi:hypothetical protein
MATNGVKQLQIGSKIGLKINHVLNNGTL